MPMTGLGAIWAVGTICTVGDRERVNYGAASHPSNTSPSPVSAVHSLSHPHAAQLHPYLNNTAA